MYRKGGKRLFDVLMAVVLTVVLSPLLVLTALLVAFTTGRPILFRQRRPGLGGRTFELLKYRTMVDARTDDGALVQDAFRLTKVGSLLRSMSVDELSELFNVLKGDMSLVGPRPLLVQYLQRYTPEQARRHEVRPGMTGWAQVNGRNAISWEQKFALDVWYVDNFSFWLDLRILAMTALKLITREGISEPGHATAREFTGTE